MASVVTLEGVSKRYRIFPSRRDRLKRVLSFGKAKAGHDFWALKDVDLEVEPGTTLGIIGRNGAGKTTLLRMISGLLQPTSGTIRVDGRLVALFALGAGFDDEYTGRENVMLNGLILGIDRREMLERFDEIEAFADIGEFMYQPVKTYSSGMRSRLGFSVAVSIEPEILVVDEALATGDAVFKAKGIQKMRELRDSGATILFVSHSTNQVKDFCTEAALLHEGTLVSRGEASRVVDEYYALIANAAEQRKNQLGLEGAPDLAAAQEDEPVTPAFEKGSAPAKKSPGLRHGTEEARILSVELLDDRGRPVDVVTPEKELTVRVHVRYAKDVDGSAVDIILRNKTGLDVFSTGTTPEKVPIGSRRAGERAIVDFTFKVPLKNGRYSITAAVSRSGSEGSQPLDWVGVAAVFKVSRPSGRDPFSGLVHLPTRVEVFEPDGMPERKPLG